MTRHDTDRHDPGRPADDGGTDATDRRGLPRWQLFETATILLDSQFDIQCRLRDVSGSGLAAETALHPEVGDEAVLYVRALGRFHARVARVADGHVAFRFLIDDERQIVLLQRLERRLIEQAEREGLALPTRH
jgi:hypothetical protein